MPHQSPRFLAISSVTFCAGLQDRAVASLGPVDQPQRLVEAPVGSSFAFDLSQIGDDLSALSSIIGGEGDVKASHQDSNIVRL